MGRPPSHGGPSFRFNPTEVVEMEGLLQAHNLQMPSREILVSLAEKFSNSAERSGKVVIQMKQVWNWFQNRRYALRAKAAKAPEKLSVSTVPPRDDLATVRNVPQAPQHLSVPPAVVRNVPQVPQSIPAPTAVQSAGRNGSDNTQMEFEAKSARDGAWYDVATFISHRSVETSEPEVLVRFAGFGAEEDEWVNVRKHVRQRSLPCESSECVVVLPGDLILCFQEGKEQALYFDAHVLDAQRRRHDVRGCRCRFLVRYDHDQSEEIVPLRKVCRRPETDYRLQQLHAQSANMNQNKTGPEPNTGHVTKVYPPAEATLKQHKADAPGETKEQLHKIEATKPVTVPVSHASVPTTTAAVPNADANITSAAVVASAAHSTASVATTTAPTAHPNVSVAATTTSVTNSNISKDTVSTATMPVAHSIISEATVSTASPLANSFFSGATSSVLTATTPIENSTDSGATVSTRTPVENSNVSVATTTASVTNSNDFGVNNSLTTTTTPVANSNLSGAPGVASVAHSDVPPDAESKTLTENVSDTGASNSAENTSTTLANTAVTSSTTTTDAVTRSMVTGSSGENTLQG